MKLSDSKIQRLIGVVQISLADHIQKVVQLMRRTFHVRVNSININFDENQKVSVKINFSRDEE